MIEKVPIIYKTFEDERYPYVGIFYIFDGYCDKCVCKEFRLDFDEAKKGRVEFSPRYFYEFSNV